MANIEVDRSGSGPARPRAMIDAYRAALHEEPAHRPQPLRARPRYSRIDLGQIIRALLIVVACAGLANIPRAEKSLTERGAVATVAASRAL